MTSIFNKTNQLFENPKRNTFNLSFQNNLTLNMGQLIPCMCKEVLPGDSILCDPTIALKANPMLFPVQTRLRAHLHFFYVTNRSLWKDWQDFIGMTNDNAEPPYIRPNTKDFKTCGLADYLGVPTTVVSSVPEESYLRYWSGKPINVSSLASPDNYRFSLDPVFGPHPSPIIYDNMSNDDSFSASDYWKIFDEINGALGIAGTNGHNVANIERIPSSFRSQSYSTRLTNVQSQLSSELDIHFDSSLYKSYLNICYYCPVFPKVFYNSDGSVNNSIILINDSIKEYIDGDLMSTTGNITILLRGNNGDTSKDILFIYNQSKSSVKSGGLKINPNTLCPTFRINNNNLKDQLMTFKEFISLSDSIEMIVMIPNVKYDVGFYGSPIKWFGYARRLGSKSGTGFTYNLSEFSTKIYEHRSEPQEINVLDNVFTNDIKLSALPWRAYESIYNSFYRDDRNNPFRINGEEVYNRFLKTYDGGEDTLVNREILKRNWESDFLTTAVQSPQQGVAPLVGITALGEITYKDAETGEIYRAQLETQDDGDTISKFIVQSANMPKGNLRQLVDFASSGISISDLRGVNALQRWLEINMRRGLRYKDQIKSHYGVNVRFDELMMPEFIGGFSTDIYVNQVNQTSQSSESPLGSIAGQAGAFGNSKHKISHYCQEHGFIIAILSISPTAQYSQLLPKHFLKRETLDYFFPEFGHLGMQPITYAEVAPNESYALSKSVTDVFGYQRAWYDYLASTDEVHGLFRTSLNNFVVQRFFNGRPELGESFLTIDPTTLDSVFAVQSDDDSHKFFGQVYFDLKMKRPIPEYGIPRLEV